MTVTVAMHQPDLLPYSGFFHKMARADIFEVGLYYQLTKSGYQRRVKMRDQWCTVPLIGEPFRSSIIEARLDPDRARSVLASTIRGRYAGARYWKLRGEELLNVIAEARETDRLWQFNLDLILGVRDMLGITTPVVVGAPLRGTKTDAIIHALQRHGPDVHHLSGPGAKVYMDEGALNAAGITLEYTRHAPVTGDSIVSVLMDYRDPLEIVLRESDDV